MSGQTGRDTNLAQMSAKANEAIPEDANRIQADQIPWNNPHWHPAHGGLYRNVRLYVTDPLHISLPLYSFLRTTGPYVYATEISDASAQVWVEVPVENGRQSAAPVEVMATIFDRDSRPVLTLTQDGQVAAGASRVFRLSGALAGPQLWEPDYPYLYRVACSLCVDEETIDSCEVPLGIRTVRWDVNTGFYINGRHLKLRGWGQKPTDEWPGLGVAQPDWMHFYTLHLMKEAGANFVRWGHCLGGPAQIEAADRLGLVTEQPGVDGESDTRGAAWTIRAAAFRDTIIYFRNHPSILIWEGGNQKVSSKHAKELRGYMDQYDLHGGRVYAHRRADSITAEFMDVGIGTEGGREIARLPVVEGEYNREESPRRVWDNASPPGFGYPEAKGQTYQLTSEQFAANQVAQFVRKLGAQDHCGGANWIFSDSTSGGRVACEVARASGEVDGVRLAKEAYYVCRAMFRSDPQVHIIGHWTYPEGTKKTVYVASNGEEVEFFVNGRSLGKGKVSDRYLFTFPDIAWEPGEIKAVAYAGGKAVATQTRHTAGPAKALRMTAITGPGGLLADGSDVALIDVEAVDAKGYLCPTFQQRVDFEVEGPVVWRGGYNSGKIKSINNTYLDLECGINRVAVRATREAGTITVKARGEGLSPGSITIQSLPLKVEAGYTTVLPLMPDVALPKESPVRPSLVPAQAVAFVAGQAGIGRFITAFSYSGPTQIVHMEQDAQDGRQVYVDRDWSFAGLPKDLVGADWVQAADNDGLYNALDLMELGVKAGSVVSVAHDDRLARPAWLTRQFQAMSLSLTVNGQAMKVFQRRIEKSEGLTLGSNTEEAGAKAVQMYVVFVNAAVSTQEGPVPQPRDRSAWMKTARWGVMTHYLADWKVREANEPMNIEKWNQMIDRFDVEGLAGQLDAVGAGYTIITIGQNSGYYLSPNATYDRLVGIAPSRCSRRDLVSDVSTALRRRGIRLIVYLPSGAPSGDRGARESLQWQNGPYPNKEFQVKWEQIIRDWSLRWGDKIDGWWFDGCYWPNVMYRSAEPPNFASFAAAARAGNPANAVAFNPGVVPRILSVTPHEDYTAGEINDPNRVEIRRTVDGKIDGTQVHILSFLGEKWGMGSPRFSTEQVVQWSQTIRKQGGVMTWDVPIQRNGLIAQPFVEQLTAVGRAIGCP